MKLETEMPDPRAAFSQPGQTQAFPVGDDDKPTGVLGVPPPKGARWVDPTAMNPRFMPPEIRKLYQPPDDDGPGS